MTTKALEMAEHQRAIEAADYVHDARQLAAKSQSLWRHDLERLAGARTELGIYLELFCADLSSSPTFSKMARLPGRFEYLWLSFLQDAEPGTPAWDEALDKESSLHGLNLPDLFTVLASLEAEDMVFLLLNHAEQYGRQEKDEAAFWLRSAKEALDSGQKAVDFVERYSNKQLHEPVIPAAPTAR
ncbi:MAG TPA: hypothetical protein VNM24_07070 [Burkholderiales bacterium]|nr:hypothetical protein [Burkholderiales bacterium]